MASKNNNECVGSSQTPDTVVCEFLTGVKKEKKTAESDRAADETTRQSKQAAKGFKICCLDRAEETHGIYQDLMTCVAIGQHKKVEIIQENVGAYIKKDEDIAKLIEESAALLNDLCTALVEANDELCTMSNCVKNKVLSKSSKVSANDKEKVEECLEEITSKSKKLVDKGKNAVESVITIAGIQTFTNTESLEDYIVNLADKMKSFKDCTEEYISSTTDEVKTAREELNAIMEELAQIDCDYAEEHTTVQGLDLVIDFICDCKCDGECLDLCAEFEKCCDKSDETPKQKSKPKKTADQN